MVFTGELKKINDLTWKIEKQGNMRIPVLIIASEKILEKIKQDDSLKQAMNMAWLPGVLKYIVVLPDAHQGYGACIGGVAAYDIEKGVISPGEIGYDINCSVRLLKTNLTKKDILKKQKKIVEALYRKIPSGLGRGSTFTITRKELNKL